MSQALAVGLTIFGGVCVFVMGQIITKFFLEPLYEQRKMFGEISDGVLYYAQYFCNPGQDDIGGNRTKASDAVRKLSAGLLAKSNAVPFYRIFAFFKIIPSSKDVNEVAKNLMFLSNSFFNGDGIRNDGAAQKVKQLLKLSV